MEISEQLSGEGVDKQDNESPDIVNNNPEVQKTSSPTNSIIFLTSNEDKASVDIICKNFEEFSNFCSENGFQMSVNSEVEKGIIVRLGQLSGNMSWKTWFQQLETMVQRKINEKTEEQQALDDMKYKWMNFDREMENVKETMEEYKKKLEDVTFSYQKEFAVKKSTKISKDDSGFDYLKNCPEILDKTIEILNDTMTPFNWFEGAEKDRNKIMRYFKFLSTDLKQPNKPNDMIGSAFFQVKHDFYYVPTADELLTAKQEMQKKTGLVNVVGTIIVSNHHLVSNQFTCSMYLAIVNQKIVYWDWIKTDKDIVDDMRRGFERGLEWLGNSKFVTYLPVKENSKNLFEYYNQEEVYKEHGKLLTWLSDNSKAMYTYDNMTHSYAIPSIYNMINM